MKPRLLTAEPTDPKPPVDETLTASIRLGADFLGLIEAFKLHPVLSTDALRVFAIYHRLDLFVKRGWISPHRPAGRWSAGVDCFWLPAGQVAECVHRARGTRSAAEECEVLEQALQEVV